MGTKCVGALAHGDECSSSIQALERLRPWSFTSQIGADGVAIGGSPSVLILSTRSWAPVWARMSSVPLTVGSDGVAATRRPLPGDASPGWAGIPAKALEAAMAIAPRAAAGRPATISARTKPTFTQESLGVRRGSSLDAEAHDGGVAAGGYSPGL
jgi:hypothetical protein